MSDISRRDLLKGAAAAGTALAAGGAFRPARAAGGASWAIAENVDAIAHPDLAPPAPARRQTMRGVPFERHEVVRVGMVGTGLRGRSVLGEFLSLQNVQVVA
ncbi:MAG TPA: twin-arginine translocation signal domain-containing protein, partial [Gemmatimonadaceae bacterium]|nr:twin-arginine translocation signal domain-containing protein [Gemmatimonadaceae bacterium]